MFSLRKSLSLLLVGILFLAPVLLLMGNAMLFYFSFDPNRTVFGFNCFSSITPSMHPAIKSSDIVVMRLCAAEDVEIGDIIVMNPYPYSTAYTTKSLTRLVQILSELDGESGLWFVTRGDADIGENYPISSVQLIGKVVGRIPVMGRLFSCQPLTLFLMYPLCWGVGLFLIILLAILRRRDSQNSQNSTDSAHSP